VTENGKKRITIIGTGLIGGSLGLALKAAGLPGVEIVGHDRHRDVATKAEKMGAVDRAEHNLHRAVEGAGLVIIATPALAVRETMQQIATDLGEGAVVTDTASTKAYVMRWALELLPDHVSFIGGHPMAGKEDQGIENAEASLFQGKAYCVCPEVDAPESAVKSILGMAQLIGAEPVFIDPEEHDVYAAAVSHMPLMMSTALFQLLRGSPSWPDMSVIASTGFRDATRLASGDPRMAHDIWVTNRESLIHWLDRMATELQRFKSLLEDANDEELLDVFAGARVDRDAFIVGTPTRTPLDPSQAATAADTRGVMMDMMIGGMLGEKVRKMTDLATNPPPAPESPGGAGSSDTAETPEKKKLSMTDRIAEGVRRDLEKMERERAEKEARKQKPPDA
jgi:prephenate dehydrogenase